MLTSIVDGWLVAEGPIPCPAPPSPFPPQDTPFVSCPPAWLTQDEVQPVSSSGTTITVTEPPNAIRVQWSAYDDDAPDPAPVANLGAMQARFGTYLVRLVTNTAFGPNGPRGWQVVARLAPQDASPEHDLLTQAALRCGRGSICVASRPDRALRDLQGTDPPPDDAFDAVTAR